MTEHPSRSGDTLIDLLHELLDDLWGNNAPNQSTGGKRKFKTPQEAKEEKAQQQNASETKSKEAAEKEAAETKTEEAASEKTAEEDQTAETTSTEKKSKKSLVKDIGVAVAGLFVPYVTSAQCWKEGKKWEAAFWAVLDTAAIVAFVVPPAGAAAETGVDALKTVRFAEKAKTLLRVAEVVERFPWLAKIGKTLMKTARRIAPWAHKINDTKIVKARKAERKVANTLKATEAAAELKTVAKETGKEAAGAGKSKARGFVSKVKTGVKNAPGKVKAALGRHSYREQMTPPVKADAQASSAATTVQSMKSYSAPVRSRGGAAPAA